MIQFSYPQSLHWRPPTVFFDSKAGSRCFVRSDLGESGVRSIFASLYPSLDMVELSSQLNCPPDERPGDLFVATLESSGTAVHSMCYGSPGVFGA